MDKLKVKILEDGTIRVDVDGEISAANHVTAEGFVTLLAERAGGKVDVVQKNPDLHLGHGHDHGEGTHQH